MPSRWSRWNKRAEELNDKFAWFFSYVMIPGLAVLTLIFAGSDLGPAYAAAHGKGTLGTFTAQTVDCHQGTYSGYHCTGYYGTFVSDDGQTRLRHVFYDRGLSIPSSLPDDPTFRVRYVKSRPPPVVYDENGSKEWVLITFLTIAAGVTLVGWLVWVTGRAQKHRRTP